MAVVAFFGRCGAFVSGRGKNLDTRELERSCIDSMLFLVPFLSHVHECRAGVCDRYILMRDSTLSFNLVFDVIWMLL